jgi:hypothetical protein
MLNLTNYCKLMLPLTNIMGLLDRFGPVDSDPIQNEAVRFINITHLVRTSVNDTYYWNSYFNR